MPRFFGLLTFLDLRIASFVTMLVHVSQVCSVVMALSCWVHVMNNLRYNDCLSSYWICSQSNLTEHG